MILPEDVVQSKLGVDGAQIPPAQTSQVNDQFSPQPQQPQQQQPKLLCGEGSEENRPPLQEQSHSSQQQQPTESSMTCDLCSACFTNTDELLQHIISSHGDASEVLRKRSRMTEEETPLNNMRCEFCGKMFFSAFDWAQHVLLVHNDRTAELQQQMAQFSGML